MQLTLIEKKEVTPGVESFIFQPSESLAWKAGQFMHLIVPHEGEDDRGHERWFTISAAPFEMHPMLTTRIAAEHGSTFKQALVGMQLGASIEMDYIDGDFTIEDASKEYVLIAGGIGITPFHSILKQADHDGVKVNATLIYANRDEHVAFKDELDVFAQKNPLLKIIYVTSPDRIDEAKIREVVPDLTTPMFYISGPEPMVKSLEGVIQNMGVAPEHIKIDDFPGYPAD